jgi:1-acyl-sn-glycerol-3-phosphate acyltransferase
MLKSVINSIVKIFAILFLKLDASELNKVPQEGPLIAIGNHINFLEPPIMIAHLHPRKTTGLVKKENWDNPLFALLFNVWGGIPIDRDIADFTAFQDAKKALKEGKILAVAPEGTRTHDGELIQGKPGVAMLALQTDVPLQAVAFFGHEGFWDNLKRFKRTPLNIRVGKRFRINLEGQRKSKEVLQSVADEMMLELAKLLPPKYWGFYADWDKSDPQFIEYLD